MALGILVGEGKVKLDDRIGDYFPEYCSEKTHEWIRNITVREALMMSTANAKQHYNMRSPNFVSHMFDLEPEKLSGVMFDYSTNATNIVTAIVEKLTGMPLLEFLKERALLEIGFSADSKVVEMPTEEAASEPEEEAPQEEAPEEVTAEEEPAPAPQEEVAEEPVEELSEEVEEEVEAPTATMTVNEPSEEGVGDWVAGQDEFTEDQNLESFEEVNIEDDIVMFGRKKREKEAAQAPVQEEKIFLESEIMEEEPELEEAPAPAPEPTPEPAPAPAPAPEPAPAPAYSNQEIVEEYEDLDEGDEDIKAPRLSKLPHLMDYALTLNMSRGNKIKMAQLMFQAFAVFKNSPENKPIVINCLAKIMKSLMEDRK
jgi:hypothetical protein